MKETKGIILAGGAGNRLYPMTSVYSKQLLAVYDKPMIYYPLSVLMLAGVKDILIISNEETLPSLEKLLKDGSTLGIRISYAVQERPEGIAQALIIGEKFIGKSDVMLILGDNVFYGNFDFLRRARAENNGATIFGYYVSDPERYGIIKFSHDGSPESIVEKPADFVSNYAVVGLYIYDSKCSEYARSLTPSKRGELEITDLNNIYLKKGILSVVKTGRGLAWLDTGTPSSLLDASNFIGTIEARQSLKIGCIEEVAARMGYLDKDSFNSLLQKYPESEYKRYLQNIGREIWQ